MCNLKDKESRSVEFFFYFYILQFLIHKIFYIYENLNSIISFLFSLYVM